MSNDIDISRKDGTKPHLNGLNAHSGAVQDIIGQPPGWMVRCGISIIVFVIVILLVGSAFVKYPDILAATIKINAFNLPAQVKAYSTGRIDTLFVNEGDIVSANTPLALIENPADYKDVLFLKENLSKVEPDSAWHCGQLLQLGEVQSTYLNYARAVNELTFFEEKDYIGTLIQSKRNQLDVLSQTMNDYRIQLKFEAEKLLIAKENYAMDSALYYNGVMSKVDFNDSKNVFVENHMSYQAMLIEVEKMEMDLLQTEQSIIELVQSKIQQQNNLTQQLELTRGQLESSIRQWEQKYLLLSPANGAVALTKFWQRNQNITAGETMLAVVPLERTVFLGKIYLSQQGAGKVKVGQNVNIKFDDYPYMEFGFVQVALSKIAMMPYDDVSSGNVYVMEVNLPDTLITQYGKQIPYNPEMSGTAEIITDDMSVFTRLINPVKAVLKR